MCPMLSLCTNYGTVPGEFHKGVLVPVPKKPTIDQTIPNNHKLITVPVTTSNPLRMHILYYSAGHCFSEYQFGFIDSSNISMALTIVNDVILYSNDSGSCVYSCSLDAEGAFDNIP